MEVKYSPFLFGSCVIVRCNLVMQFSGESSVASVYYRSTESRSLDFHLKTVSRWRPAHVVVRRMLFFPLFTRCSCFEMTVN